jgi:hypothetical protein
VEGLKEAHKQFVAEEWKTNEGLYAEFQANAFKGNPKRARRQACD